MSTQNVKIETVGKLGRKLNVRIPVAEIETAIDVRLKKLVPKVRKDGFRPGKVPFAVIKKDYGHDVYHEVIEDLMKKHFETALKESNLTPADRPQIRVVHTDHQHAAQCEQIHGHHHEGHAHEHANHAHHQHAAGDDYFEYEATFDVYPEVVLPDLSTIKIEKLNPVISEEDIEDGLRRLQRAHATYTPVEHAATKEDRVQSHTKGTLIGEETPFMDRAMEIVLGQNAFLPEFEKHILGIKPGETRTFQITFPADYQPTMAGKKAEFIVKADIVETAQLPEMDAEFCKKIGFEGDIEALRNVLRTQMLDNAQAVSRKIAHEKVLQALFAACDVTVPESLVQKELAEISDPRHPQKVADPEKTARERVAFSLLLGQFIREHNVQADPERVREVIRGLVGNAGNPDEMLKWLLKDSQRMARVQAMALEESALDELLTKVAISEKEISFEQIMKEQAK